MLAKDNSVRQRPQCAQAVHEAANVLTEPRWPAAVLYTSRRQSRPRGV